MYIVIFIWIKKTRNEILEQNYLSFDLSDLFDNFDLHFHPTANFLGHKALYIEVCVCLCVCVCVRVFDCIMFTFLKLGDAVREILVGFVVHTYFLQHSQLLANRMPSKSLLPLMIND